MLRKLLEGRWVFTPWPTGRRSSSGGPGCSTRCSTGLWMATAHLKRAGPVGVTIPNAPHGRRSGQAILISPWNSCFHRPANPVGDSNRAVVVSHRRTRSIQYVEDGELGVRPLLTTGKERRAEICERAVKMVAGAGFAECYTFQVLGDPPPWLGPASASRALRGARPIDVHEPVAQQTTKVRTGVQYPLTRHDNTSHAISTVRRPLEARIPSPDMRTCTLGGAWRWRAWRESNPRPTA